MVGIAEARATWLGRFILPHEAALRAWLARRPVAGLDVDDIIQETYAKLIAMETVDGIRDPRSYLFQVAKSVIAGHLRSRKVVSIVYVSDLDVLEATADEPSAEVQISDREELQRLAEAVAALPEPTQTIFCLRRIERLAQRKIAARLSMPESTVEKHISRALLFMAERLGRGGKRDAGASRRRAEARRIEDDAGDG